MTLFYSCVSSLLLLLFSVNFVCAQRMRRDSAVLDVIHEWNSMNFGFPSDNERQQAINSQQFVEQLSLPIDVGVQYQANGKRRTFVTIPRFTLGIPYTLATVVGGKDNPMLQAYPSYSWHNSHGADCDGITSAFRMAFTPCNQMWVIDSGVINGVQRCAPQLLLFDLSTDKLVHRYRFNENIYIPRASLFITPVVKVDDPPPSGNCRRTMVYVADVTSHGLVMYDYANGVAWRAEHPYMYPDPDQSVHKIAGETFTLSDGLFGLSIANSKLFFHPLASEHEFSVPLEILSDRSAWEANVEAHGGDFRNLGHRESACAAEATDSSENLYCVTFHPIRLERWNVNTPFKGKYFKKISDEQDLLQFVSGMKVVVNPKGEEELWMISNRFQKSATETMTRDEVNFRILKVKLDNPKMNSDLSSKLIFS